MPIQSHDPKDHMDPEESYCAPFSMPMPEKHFVSFGRFLLACTGIESAAHNFLRPMLLMEESMARTLIGQPRLEELLTIIAKVCAHLGHGPAEMAALKEIREKAQYVYRVRNIVAHQEPAWREGWMRYDRYATAKDISQRENLLYILKLEELDNLTKLAQLLVSPFGAVTVSWSQTKKFDLDCMAPLRAFFQTRDLPADPQRPFRASS